MVEAKILLPFALAALVAYVIDNARRVKKLKKENSPEKRAEFFTHKIAAQLIAILLVPATCLLLSNTFGRALHPGPTNSEFGALLTAVTGVSGRDLGSLLSLKTIALAACGILALEAIPLIYKSKSPVNLGDVSVLLPCSPVELVWCALLALIAGIGEELLFRGFIPLGIAGFNIPFDTALFISVLLFAACHLYQGLIGVVATGLAGAVLTAAYVLTGSLASVIAIHVAIDLVGLVIRPMTGMGLRRIFRSRRVHTP